MRKQPPAFLLAALIGSLLALPAVQAQRAADPTALVEQRQARMKALGASMKTLGGFAKGEASAPDAVKAADVLAAGGRAMPGWWARGTGLGASDSEAAPKIWTDAVGFRKQIATFARASAQMQVAARTGDAARVGAELRNVGGSCKSCHDGYRVED